MSISDINDETASTSTLSDSDKNKAVVKRFKKCYKEFIRDFCKAFPEHTNAAKEVYFNIDNWYEFISDFIKNLEPYILNISQKDDTIFIENKLTIIQNINSSDIWKNINTKNRDIIWKYMQTLYILGITYKGDMGDLSKIIENINNLDNEDLISNLNEQAKIMVDMFKNISLNNNADTVDSEEKEDTTENSENSENAEKFEDMLQNSKIADLAKELSEEINLDDDFSDPADIMNKLTSDPTKMFDLIKVIGGKIQSKINTGDLNEGDLVNEAQNMFSKISSNNNIFNNDILKKMASSMAGGAGGSGGGGMPNMANMAGMMGNLFNDDASRSSKRNERLKKKLDEKKQFMESLEKKAQELNLENNTVVEEVKKKKKNNKK